MMYITRRGRRSWRSTPATGEVLWRYDPQAIGARGAHACCDVVNRGVAV